MCSVLVVLSLMSQELLFFFLQLNKGLRRIFLTLLLVLFDFLLPSGGYVAASVCILHCAASKQLPQSTERRHVTSTHCDRQRVVSCNDAVKPSVSSVLYNSVWQQNVSSPLLLHCQASRACGCLQALFHLIFLRGFGFIVCCCLFIRFLVLKLTCSGKH